MARDVEKFERSIGACVENARRLLEDAEWLTHRASTGLALTMLAQEECAKAFVLALVRDEVLPWTEDVRRSLSVHECKNLVTLVMEWLSTVNESRLNETIAKTGGGSRSPAPPQLPPDVATAMNIYRHEMIERIGRRCPERYTEWRGVARKVAEGRRDRKKQEALYVSVAADGDVQSLPPTSEEAFNLEFAKAKVLIEFVDDVGRRCIFARTEYEMFAEIFKAIFEDLEFGAMDSASPEEVIPSGIPGIVLVRKTITVADVVSPECGGQNEQE